MPTLLVEDKFTTGGTWDVSAGSPTILDIAPPTGGKTLNLNAIGEYVYWNIPDVGATRIVLGVWVRYAAPPASASTRVFKIDAGPTEGWMYVLATGGRPRIQSDGTPTIPAATAVNDILGNTWAWCQLMYDVSANPWELRLKIGSEVLSSTGAAAATTLNAGVCLLGNTVSGEALDFHFGHMKMGSAANDNDWWPEPQSKYDAAVLATSPSSYYPFSDGIDYGSNGFNMTKVNGPGDNYSLVPSEQRTHGRGIYFATDDWVSLGDVYDFSSHFSIAYWMYIDRDTPANFRRVWCKRNTGTPFAGYVYYVYDVGGGNPEWGVGLEIIQASGTNEGQGVAPGFRSKRVYFVCHTWNNTSFDHGTYWNGYWNGYATNYTVGFPATTAPFLIGADENQVAGANNFLGVLSKFAIWDGRELTVAEMDSMWLAGLGSYRVQPPFLRGG